MAAQPGGKDYGRLTVMLAAYAEVESLFDVGPGRFTRGPRSGRRSCGCARPRGRDSRSATTPRCAPWFGGVLAPTQDPAQRLKGLLERGGHRSLRDRSAAAPGNAGAGRNSACLPPEPSRPPRRAQSPSRCAHSAILVHACPAIEKCWCCSTCRTTANGWRRRARPGRPVESRLRRAPRGRVRAGGAHRRILMPSVQVEKDHVERVA